MEQEKYPRPSQTEWEKYWEFVNNDDIFSEEFLMLCETYDWSPEYAIKDGKYGVRTANGEIVLQPDYDDLYLYDLLLKDSLVTVKKNGKWGIVKADGIGTWVVEPQFDDIGFPLPLTLVKSNDRWGVYDIEKKEYFIPPECEDFNDYLMGRVFANEVALCYKDGKYGVATSYGIYTGAIFEEVNRNEDGLVEVKLNGTWGWINEDGLFTTDEDEAYVYEEI